MDGDAGDSVTFIVHGLQLGVQLGVQVAIAARARTVAVPTTAGTTQASRFIIWRRSTLATVPAGCAPTG